MFSTVIEGSRKKALGFIEIPGFNPCLAVYGGGYQNNRGEAQIVCSKDYAKPEAAAIFRKGEIDAIVLPNPGMHVVRVERHRNSFCTTDQFEIFVFRVMSSIEEGLFSLKFFSRQVPQVYSSSPAGVTACSFLPIELAKVICVAVRKTYLYKQRESTYVVKEHGVGTQARLNEGRGNIPTIVQKQYETLNTDYNTLVNEIDEARKQYIRQIY